MLLRCCTLHRDKGVMQHSMQRSGHTCTVLNMHTQLSPHSRPSDKARETLPLVLAGNSGVYLFTGIYDAYSALCRDKGWPIQSRQAVGIALHQLGHVKIRSGVETAWRIRY